MAQILDGGGNVWHKQEEFEAGLNTGVRGAHVSMPFQCKDCWIVNLEGRERIEGLDDAS